MSSDTKIIAALSRLSPQTRLTLRNEPPPKFFDIARKIRDRRKVSWSKSLSRATHSTLWKKYKKTGEYKTWLLTHRKKSKPIQKTHLKRPEKSRIKNIKPLPSGKSFKDRDTLKGNYLVLKGRDKIAVEYPVYKSVFVPRKFSDYGKSEVSFKSAPLPKYQEGITRETKTVTWQGLARILDKYDEQKEYLKEEKPPLLVKEDRKLPFNADYFSEGKEEGIILQVKKPTVERRKKTGQARPKSKERERKREEPTEAQKYAFFYDQLLKEGKGEDEAEEEAEFLLETERELAENPCHWRKRK